MTALHKFNKHWNKPAEIK